MNFLRALGKATAGVLAALIVAVGFGFGIEYYPLITGIIAIIALILALTFALYDGEATR